MPVPRYREVVVAGPDGWTQGFVEGYLRGAGLDAAVHDAEREGFDCAPLRERVRDLFDRHAATLHLLVPEDALRTFEAAVGAAARAGRHLEISAVRPLRGARFVFAFTTYSRQHADRIRGDFENPPPGAALLPGARFEESVRPEAAGLELHAPDHVYRLDGRGTIEGDIPPVLALYRRYREEELVRLEPLELLGHDGP